MILPQLREHAAVIAIVFVYGLIALAFLLLNPPFEGTDEVEHFLRVRQAAHGSLLPDPITTRPPGQYHQPPFYYALVAPLLRLGGDSDFERIYDQQNPYYNGLTTPIFLNDNRNRFLHFARQEFPELSSPTMRSLYLIRLVSVLFGIGTIVAGDAILRRLFPKNRLAQWVALAVVAFNPQFVYHTSQITNDSLVFFWGALTTAWLLAMLERPPRLLNRLILALMLGVGLTIKMSLIASFVAVGAAVLMYPLHRRQLVLALFLSAPLFGWWTLHNLLNYGDPTLNRINYTVWFVQPLESLTPAYMLERLWILHQRAWGVFGYGQVWSPTWIYVLFAALLVIGSAGLVRIAPAITRELRRTAFVIIAYFLGCLLPTLYLTFTLWQGNHGRYLLTAGFALGACIAAGGALLSHRVQRIAGAAALIGMPVVPVLSLVLGLFPAYHPQLQASTDVLPLFRYGNAAELILPELLLLHAAPGELVQVDLQWRTVTANGGDWRTYIHTADGAFRHDSYPATGKHIAANWQPGQVWSETQVFTIPDTLTAQMIYPLLVGLYDTPTAQSLPTTDASGTETVPQVGVLVIHGPAQEPGNLLARFGESIALAGIQVEGAQICMNWFALRDDDAVSDVRRFVHLFDADGAFIGQHDGDPHEGNYPARYWRAGEVIEDCVAIDSETGAIALGWYDAATLNRLPVMSADGTPMTDGLYRWQIAQE